MKAFFRFTLTLWPALGLLCGCSNKLIHHQATAFGYGTSWEIHLYEGSQDDCQEIADFIASTSSLFDVTELGRNSKGISALNKTYEFVELDPMAIECLLYARDAEVFTGGAFSYHIGDLSDLWNAALKKGEIPSEKDIKDALDKDSNTYVEIQNYEARRIGEAKIDLNGISKGLCCFKIEEKLKKKGITKYFVNGGSSSLLIGENDSQNGDVKVTLADAPSRSFQAKNISVSCSSVSRQSYEIGGKAYSHIINPLTGMAISNYQAVYLRGEKSYMLDAYSTAAMVLPTSFTSFLTDKHIDYAYVENGEVTHATSGFLN